MSPKKSPKSASKTAIRSKKTVSSKANLESLFVTKYYEFLLELYTISKSGKTFQFFNIISKHKVSTSIAKVLLNNDYVKATIKNDGYLWVGVKPTKILTVNIIDKLKDLLKKNRTKSDVITTEEKNQSDVEFLEKKYKEACIEIRQLNDSISIHKETILKQNEIIDRLENSEKLNAEIFDQFVRLNIPSEIEILDSIKKRTDFLKYYAESLKLENCTSELMTFKQHNDLNEFYKIKKTWVYRLFKFLTRS